VRPGSDADHSPISSAEVRMSKSYAPLPPWCRHSSSRTALINTNNMNICGGLILPTAQISHQLEPNSVHARLVWKWYSFTGPYSPG
jgi:hypothetical protein